MFPFLRSARRSRAQHQRESRPRAKRRALRAQASGVAPLCWSSRLMGLAQLHLILRTDLKSVE